MVGYIISTLLQIVCRMWQWKKNFFNLSIIGEDMDKSKVPRFYGPQCISTLLLMFFVLMHILVVVCSDVFQQRLQQKNELLDLCTVAENNYENLRSFVLQINSMWIISRHGSCFFVLLFCLYVMIFMCM